MPRTLKIPRKRLLKSSKVVKLCLRELGSTKNARIEVELHLVIIKDATVCSHRIGADRTGLGEQNNTREYCIYTQRGIVHTQMKVNLTKDMPHSTEKRRDSCCFD